MRASINNVVYTPTDVPHKYTVGGDQLVPRLEFEMFFAEGGSPLDWRPAGAPNLEGFQCLVEITAWRVL